MINPGAVLFFGLITFAVGFFGGGALGIWVTIQAKRKRDAETMKHIQEITRLAKSITRKPEDETK